jgi:TolB-like protein
MEEESPNRVTAPAGAVFLSYASQDIDAARRICDALRASGIEVWFDQSELRGGDVWDQKIRREIHDCALFIPIVSEHTQERLEGYFRHEWKLAVERTHHMAEQKPFLVPVVIDSTRDQDAIVPDLFREVQWTRLPAGETPSTFVEHVRRLLTQESATSARQTASATHAAAPPLPATTLEHRSRAWPSIIAVLLAGLLAYLAIDKFWLSKHVPVSQPSTAAVPVTPAGTAEKSIAVLPFVDMSEKRDQEYFADGVAEEVLDELARVPGLRVIGRTSSFQFKDKSQDLRAIGRALGAAYIVEGSVRRSDDRLRVTAQLVNAADGSHVWSQTYEEAVTDLLRIQDRIATSLARALEVTFDASAFNARPTFASSDAYEMFLRGRLAQNRYDREGFEAAADYYQQALQIDPRSAPAAEQLALSLELSAEWGYVPPQQGFQRARFAAQHALGLNPRSSIAYATLAKVDLIYDWDWGAAERAVKQALRFNPRDLVALGVLGQLEAALGRWEESVRIFNTALVLDPLEAGWRDVLGNIRYRTGHLAEAEKELRTVLRISPIYGEGHFYLGQVLLAQEKLDAAFAEMNLERPDTGRDAGLAIVLQAMGRRSESNAALARLTKDRANDAAFEIAQVHAYRHELDQAFDWLDRAYRQKDVELFWIKGDPLLKTLEADPRYKTFLRKMNLPE